MKISILLPFKENFSPSYAGAVSLNINDILKYSKFKKILQFLVIQNLKKDLKINILILKQKKDYFKVKIKTM